jgi:hypothetical protein
MRFGRIRMRSRIAWLCAPGKLMRVLSLKPRLLPLGGIAVRCLHAHMRGALSRPASHAPV